MKQNKEYNTRKKVRFSILIAMLVLSSLLRTTFAIFAADGANIAVLSLKGLNQPICYYFKQIPKNEDFKSWSKEVKRIAADHKLAAYLTDWLADIERLEAIITLRSKKEQKKITLSRLIRQHQAKQESLCAMLHPSNSQLSLGDQSGKLVNIGNLSSGRCISREPAIAVIDELYRVSMRNWGFTSTARAIAQKTYDLCLEIALQELEEDQKAKIVALLTYSPCKDLMKSISSTASSLLRMVIGNDAAKEKND